MALSTPLTITSTGGVAQGTDHTYDLQPVDDGATSGNTRGVNSVDLQTIRTLPAQVASGISATISGGRNGKADGDYSTVGGGTSNTSGGDTSIAAGGGSNEASGAFAAVGGGFTNLASGISSSIPGGVYGKADKYGQQAHSSGRFGATGDAQRSDYVLRNSVTHSDATWTELFLDGTNDQLVLATDTVWTFDILITGATAGMVKTFSYGIVGAIKNDGGTTSLKGTPTVTDIEEADDTDFDARVSADDASNALAIEVQDSSSGSDVVRWVAHVRTVEITFA